MELSVNTSVFWTVPSYTFTVVAGDEWYELPKSITLAQFHRFVKCTELTYRGYALPVTGNLYKELRAINSLPEVKTQSL